MNSPINYPKWREGLKSYLFNQILNNIVPDEEMRARLVNDEAMEIWEVAFTHETFDPNVGSNYEELEMYGDIVMAANFIKYLTDIFPKINKQELSEMKISFLSKEWQGKKSIQLGLNKWIRSNIRTDLHTAEDVLESFFGALDRIGDMVYKFGAGGGLSYNMIIYILDNTGIDENAVALISEGNPKTQIKEMFEQLGWGVADEKFEVTEDGRTISTVSFTFEAIQDLKKLGLKIQDPRLAVEEGFTKGNASRAAYTNALKRLKEMGLTKDWVNTYRYGEGGTSDTAIPELSPYISRLNEKLRLDGFTGFKFKRPKTGKIKGRNVKGVYIQLLGVRPNGHLEILETTDGMVDNEIEGKKQVLARYVMGR